MRILWLKTELLHPVDKGGKIRTYHMLKELKRGHHITYLTLDDGTAGQDARECAREYCHELVCVPHRPPAKFSPRFYVDLALNLPSRLPYAIQKYKSARMRREIATRTQAGAFDLLICDFLTPSVNLPDRIPCPTLLFQHNVEAMIWKRLYEVQTNPLKRSYLQGQWRKTYAFEGASCRRFDYVVAVSGVDREKMQREYGIEYIVDVPTGVDTEYFRPCGIENRKPHSLLFTGSMDWLPNEDAIRHFTEQIMPRVRQAIPDVRLTVVGRYPSPSLIELVRRDPAIVLTGRVGDVRPYMEQAAAYVVPLRIGGGTRLKIYEAMAMEKAVVSTSIGAEGLPVRDGVDLLLADTPQAFANAVVRVLTDPELADRLGAHAARTVRERFTWGKVAECFVEICQRCLREHVGVTEENAKARRSESAKKPV